MTQIGQNEPLAPAAAQMPTHSSEGYGRRTGAMSQPRPREGARRILGSRHGRGGQVLEQAQEVAVGASRVGRVEALVELLRREPSDRRVRAEPARDVLALGIGGADGSVGVAHRPNARTALRETPKRGDQTDSSSLRPSASVATHTTG
jgi:hypothetical protein